MTLSCGAISGVSMMYSTEEAIQATEGSDAVKDFEDAAVASEAEAETEASTPQPEVSAKDESLETTGDNPTDIPDPDWETPEPDEAVSPKPYSRQDFYALDFRRLDKNLSPDEQREWNAIYASFRAGSLLTGKIAGVDTIRMGDRKVDCLVGFDYRVKVLIPDTEVWADESATYPNYILRSFPGAEVDYIVKQVDREGGCVVASRKEALLRRRKSFRKNGHNPGDIVDCRVAAVGIRRMLVEIGGYDVMLSQQDISYGTILNLREDYRPGQTVKAVFKGFENHMIRLSIRDVNPHPFDNAEDRHPLRSRRVSRIMGKYAGGVFCELEKGFTCLCLYSPEQQDCDFDPGDDVILVVTRYDYENKLVYGRIVTAW